MKGRVTISSDMAVSNDTVFRMWGTLHFAPVAQLDRASACGAEGRRFKSCRVYQNKILIFDGYFILVSPIMIRTYDSTTLVGDSRRCSVAIETKESIRYSADIFFCE
jgi:hypothetical protein